MKLVYFKRRVRPNIVYGGSSAEALYVPCEDAILYREEHGMSSEPVCSVTDEQRLLDEIKSALKGKTPDAEEVKYSRIKVSEADGSEVEELLENAKLATELREKVTTSIENLLKKAKPKPGTIREESPEGYKIIQKGIRGRIFAHCESTNRDGLLQRNILYVDRGCDGFVDEITTSSKVYEREDPGTERIFKIADLALKLAKIELGVE